MATTIKLKNGSGAPLAGDLVQGEPALDLTNKRLYTEDSGGTVIEVGTNPTSLTTGTFTSTGIDDNATSTAVTIDASENVGIGTSSPVSTAKLHVSQSSAEGTPTSFSYGGAVIQNNQTSIYGTALYIIAGSAGNSSVSFGDKDASAVGEISYNHSNNSLAFSTNTTERLRIDSSGTVQFQNAVEEQQYSLTGTVIDPSNGTIQYKSLSANTTLTESFSDGEYVTLMINDGAGYTITWPAISWVGGSAPTLETTGYNVIELWHVNNALYGAFVGAAG
jgi:hypothetical protein